MHVLPVGVPGRLPARPLRHAVQVQHQATSAARSPPSGSVTGLPVEWASGFPWLQQQILGGLQLGEFMTRV
jgi:hypothetical protein